MANYFVVLPEDNVRPADSTVGVKPTETSQILERIRRGRFVKVEAGSVADAQRAVQVTYGIVSTPVVVAEAAWKES